MPYKDPERRKAYNRQYSSTRRVGDDKPKNKPRSNPVLPLPVRVETAKDVLAQVAEQWGAVKVDPDASTIEKARAVALLARVALQAIDAADVAARLEELEALVAQHMGGKRHA